MTDQASPEAEHPAGQAAKQLLESLVCPASGTRLKWDSAAQELISTAAGLAYPVRDGIPIMLIDEARKLDD